MRSSIKLHDKEFNKYISEEEISALVLKLAKAINSDYKDKKPILVSILDGSFMFTSDLLRKLEIEHDLVFVKLKSYFGTKSSGQVDVVMPLDQKIKGRDVIIVEDIVDTGTTLYEFKKMLMLNNPQSISICSLLLKPLALNYDLALKYIGLEIPNDFVVGYGMDYDGAGRNLPEIYVHLE